MKRFLTVVMAAMAIIAAVSSCQKEDKAEVLDGPSLVWASNPEFGPVDITDEMDVVISVSAPAGISSFIVKIDSDVLNSAPLNLTELDLVNPGDYASIADMVLGEGIEVEGATSLDLDLSELVPMILLLNPAKDSDHTFTVFLEDKAGKTLEQACVFHYAGMAEVTVESADLWLNTAVVKADGVESLSYRIKGTQEWIPAEPEDGRFVISPVWETSKNGYGLDIYTVKAGTGIYAGNVYEFQADGIAMPEVCDYQAAAGDVIPNGDMSGWSETEVDYFTEKVTVPYPNAAGDTFWTSGNNGAARELLTEDSGSAKMQATVAIVVFAPGNMYTGSFVQDGMSGTASFGQKYAWTARPKALRVKYRSEIGVIDYVGQSTPAEYGIVEGETEDKARIFAAVIDWSAQHGVNSGLGVDPSETVWDPVKQKSVDGAGNIIGYASQFITESTSGNGFQELVIPFEWYDIESRPGSDSYSIVISCATSYLGDFLTGCSTNSLWVDDFEWVY